MVLSHIVMFALFAQVSASSDSRLSVRAVDPLWLPLSSDEIRLWEVDKCHESNAPTPSTAQHASTDATGSASFPVASHHTYMVEAGGENGFERIQNCVALAGLRQGDVAYVQLRLRLDPRSTVALRQPAVSTGRTVVSPGLELFEGIFVDADRRFYRVHLDDENIGLAVELPDGRILTFPVRRKLVFLGPDGQLTFRLKGEKVVSFLLVPKMLKAEAWVPPE